MSSKLILITGMSASGKTTLASRLNDALRERGIFSLHVDGIEFRNMVSNHLFDRNSIEEMFSFIRNFTEVMKEKNVILIYSLVAHKRSQRESLKRIIDTLHIHLEASLNVLKSRDYKGVYERADKEEFFLPGYSERYEDPIGEDLLLDSSKLSVEKELELVLDLLKSRRWI